jgi:hypothetical protein
VAQEQLTTPLSTSPLPTTAGRKDVVISSRFQLPASIVLCFDDGKQFDLPIVNIPIDASRIHWQTSSLSRTGEQLILLGVKGDAVPIDAGVLRCLVDDEYAAEVKNSLKKLRMTRDELIESARDMPAPPDWVYEPSPDLRRDSWK